ncbi:MAG: hypothetical protein D6772_12975, partial [Bacteroidetes bacterium]
MKKGFVLFMFVSGLCSCICEDVLPYWNVTNFSVQIKDQNYQLPTDSLITTDTLLLQLDLETEFLAQSSFHGLSAFFANQMWAFSCDDDGFAGMKDPWESITVTSNQDFAEVLAGESLNKYIFLSGDVFLEDFIDNAAGSYPYRKLDLWLSPRPEEVALRNFTITIVFASGDTLA